MATFKKLNVQDEVTNRIQDNTAKAVNQLSSNALTSGSILTSQTLKAGDNTINHKLGKTLTGWFIVRQRGAASIYDKQDSNSSPSQTLILNSSAAVSVDIYVF
jgi:hypothetical protein